MSELETTPAAAVDIGAFCRDVEAHLCRINGGHLVRIVGPAFDLVAGWAREGVPLRVVQHGMERTVSRLTARGPRRRPVRIEFCEHDVRDACAQWRRALGVHAAREAEGPPPAEGALPGSPPLRAPSLARHAERVLLRLSSVRATRDLPPSLLDALDETLRGVDSCLDASRGARGAARQAVADRLREVEGRMTAAALAALTAGEQEKLLRQARDELAGYVGQLPADAYRAAEQALLGQLARRHFALPQVALDG